MAATFSPSPLFRLLLAAGTMLLSAHAAERPSSATSAPPPPVPAAIKVKRGEVTEIPLRIFGTRAQTLSFIIRTAPGAGKLSAPKNVTGDSAVVRYTPPTDRAVTRDSFTYAVRSSEGVSAGADVKIEIVDTPAELIAPVELKNTNLLVGETETLTLELTNRSGGFSEGDVTADAPWRVEPPAHYRIEGNGHAILHLTFAPEAPGEFHGEVHYSSQADRLTSLSGTAAAPLAIRPATLELRFESLTGRRSGAFEITNNTKTEQTVTIHNSERLKLDPRLTLAPGRNAAVTVQTRPDDTDELAEVIRFDARGLTALLPVRAAAVKPSAPTTPIPAKAPVPTTPAPSTPEPPHPIARPVASREPPHEAPPEPESVSHHFDPLAVTQRIDLTPTSVTIEWPASAAPADCHAETRDLSLREKELVTTWRRIGDVQITAADNNKTRAVFTQLQPGQGYTFRIVAPIGDAGADEPVAFVSFITPKPPPSPSWVTWPRLLGLALLVLLGRAIIARLRSRETSL